MTKILIVGTGGIGSKLTEQLNQLIMLDQINIDDVEIFVADGDVVEAKNVKLGQNFTKDDIFKNKAKAIANRYCFEPIPKMIKEAKDLEGYDLIISCADNSKVRELIYNYCYANNKYYIDLRSEGRAFCFYTKEEERSVAIKSLGKEITEKGKSCQMEYRAENNILDWGYVCIASIGSQLVLNYLRGDKNPKQMILRV